MRVNLNKTKVMISAERQKATQKAVRWLCGVCGRGVGNNSIQCYSALVVRSGYTGNIVVLRVVSHVTQKAQSRDLVTFRCKYLENALR